jgi:hypothetical protein
MTRIRRSLRGRRAPPAACPLISPKRVAASPASDPQPPVRRVSPLHTHASRASHIKQPRAEPRASRRVGPPATVRQVRTRSTEPHGAILCPGWRAVGAAAGGGATSEMGGRRKPNPPNGASKCVGWWFHLRYRARAPGAMREPDRFVKAAAVNDAPTRAPTATRALRSYRFDIVFLRLTGPVPVRVYVEDRS